MSTLLIMAFTPSRLRLQPGRWYAAQFLGAEYGPDDAHAFSPIRVESTRTLRTDKREWELTFHHENYPAGEQRKIYPLRMVVHEPSFLVGVRVVSDWHDRYLLITELSWGWLRTHFGITEQHTDVQDWAGTRTA